MNGVPRANVLTASKACIIGLITAVLYLPGLDHSPPHLAHDEALFGLQARSVALSGRDINGNFLPVYFVESGYGIGRDPIHVYLTALVLKMAPFSQGSIRAAAALVGVINVVLIFFLARRVVSHEWLAWVAAAMLALTPVHFIHSRLSLSVIYPLAFVIGWLLCFAIYLHRAQLRWLVASGLVLGFGVYSYLASLVMMPVYWLISVAALLARRSLIPIAVVTAAFALPLTLLAAWHLTHPDRYRDIVNAYRIYDANSLNPLQGVRDLSSYFSLGERTAVYWQAFNPGRWFFTGDSSLVKSTRLVGLFLMPVAPLLLSGILTAARSRSLMHLVLLAGLLTAPLPEVLLAQPEIGRWLVVVPFVVILATIGAEAIWQSGGRGWRAALILLLLAMPAQFLLFYRDYTTDYRVRAERWFGGGDTHRAMGEARRLAPDAVYLSDSIIHAEAYWKFHAHADGADVASIRTLSVHGSEVPSAEPAGGAAYITPPVDDAMAERIRGAGWRPAASIRNLDGEVAFMVWSNRTAAHAFLFGIMPAP